MQLLIGWGRRERDISGVCYLLEGTHWALLCGCGVPGIVPVVAHRDVTGPPVSPPDPRTRARGSPTDGEAC